MSEGIEKKCTNIEKKSINKAHSYSIAKYIYRWYGALAPPLYFYSTFLLEPPLLPESCIVTTTHESGVIVSQGLLSAPLNSLVYAAFRHHHLNRRPE